MNLVWFITIGAIFSIILGEFGQYPFGVTSSSVSLTDILLSLALFFLFVWKVSIKKEVRFLKVLIPLSVFWLVGSVSLVLSGELSGGLYLIRFMLYSTSLLLGYELIKSGIKIGSLIRVILYSLVTLLSLGFLQILFFPDMSLLTDFGFDPHKNRMFSTLLDPNFFGLMLNIGFLMSLYFYFLKPQRKWIYFCIAFSIGIFLTFSRSAYLALLIEILILGFFRMRKLLIISLVIFTLLFLLVPKFNERVVGGINVDKTASERIESWKKGFSIFTEQPFIGVGFNNLRVNLEKQNLLKTYSIDGGNSGAGVDSSLVFILATTGVIGLSVYLYFWIDILKKIKRQKIITSALLGGLLINSQFINSLFFPPIMLIYFLILGAFIANQE